MLFNGAILQALDYQILVYYCLKFTLDTSLFQFLSLNDPLNFSPCHSHGGVVYCLHLLTLEVAYKDGLHLLLYTHCPHSASDCGPSVYHQSYSHTE